MLRVHLSEKSERTYHARFSGFTDYGTYIQIFWADVPHRNRDHRAYGAVRHVHSFFPEEAVIS